MPYKKNQESGFAPILLLAVIAVLGLILVTQTPNSKNSSNSSVMGVLIARDGADSSSDSSGSSHSDNPGTPPPPPINTAGLHINTQIHPGMAPNSHIEDRPRIGSPSARIINFSQKNGHFEVTGEDGSGSAKPVPFGSTVTREATAGGQLITITVTTPRGTKQIVIRTSVGGLQLESNGFAANTTLPVSLDNSTHELTVSTPDGIKPINILPDEAARIATGSGDQNKVEDVSLSQSNNSPVFNVNGFKTGTLFGFIPFSSPVQMQINADSGQVIFSSQSFFDRLLSPFIR